MSARAAAQVENRPVRGGNKELNDGIDFAGRGRPAFCVKHPGSIGFPEAIVVVPALLIHGRLLLHRHATRPSVLWDGRPEAGHQGSLCPIAPPIPRYVWPSPARATPATPAR